eukprot:1392304-Amorphochlora_amoeboformis.AAC.1
MRQIEAIIDVVVVRVLCSGARLVQEVGMLGANFRFEHVLGANRKAFAGRKVGKRSYWQRRKKRNWDIERGKKGDRDIDREEGRVKERLRERKKERQRH